MRALVVALLLTGGFGCAKAAFTQGVRERFGLGREDLRRIQFFNSEAIVLEREAVAQARSLDNSELVLRQDVRIEQITVDERTPCVVLRVEGEYLLMGFSPKDPRAALWFRAQRAEDADSASERRYELVALENGMVEPAPFQPRWSKGFLVNWAGKAYHITEGRSAYLLYDLDDDVERDLIKESAPGWRLGEKPLPKMPAEPEVPTSQALPPPGTGPDDVELPEEPPEP